MTVRRPGLPLYSRPRFAFDGIVFSWTRMDLVENLRSLAFRLRQSEAGHDTEQLEAQEGDSVHEPAIMIKCQVQDDSVERRYRVYVIGGASGSVSEHVPIAEFVRWPRVMDLAVLWYADHVFVHMLNRRDEHMMGCERVRFRPSHPLDPGQTRLVVLINLSLIHI